MCPKLVDHEMKLEATREIYMLVTLMATDSPATGSAGDRLIIAYGEGYLISCSEHQFT